jgi:phytoene dehydrogenase-like protein
LEQDRDVIVVGAGHNGLTAACYLAKAGRSVTVLEANPWIGGCTTSAPLVKEAPEHSISPCAAEFIFLHAGTVVGDLELARHGFAEIIADPMWAYLHPDGASLLVWRSPEKTADEIGRFSQPDRRAYLELARIVNSALDACLPLMLTNPTRPDPRAVLRSAAAARAPRRLAQAAALARKSAAELIDERFEHPVVRGMLAMTCAWLTPFTMPGSGTDLLVMGVAQRLGAGRPIGGTQILPDALARCLAEYGGTIQTSTPVAEILIDSGRATGVRLTTGEELRAEVVLSATDPYTTLNKLLPNDVLPAKQQRRAEQIPTSYLGMSSFKVDVAFKGRLTLKRHQAARADAIDLRKPAVVVGTFEQCVEAVDVAHAGRFPSPNPFVSVVPTAVDPSQAPAGQDTMYLWLGWMPNEPAGGSWPELKAKAADELLAHVAQYYDGIEELEIGRFVESKPDLIERTNAHEGNIYHVDLTAMTVGPNRPAPGFGGYRTPVPGLFITGAGTHPVPAVSGIPGQLAARTILKSVRSARDPKAAGRKSAAT